jgi:hypothetical protein
VTTWRKEISDALETNGETWADVESITLTQADLDIEFDAGYGIIEGAPFTLWTARRVYFPDCYDGSEQVSSVSRHPDGKATYHIGGG